MGMNQSQVLSTRMFLLPRFNYFTRIADGNAVGWYVFGHDAAGAD